MNDPVEQAHKKLTHQVIGLPGVSAVGIGAKSGKPCLKVFVEDGSTAARAGIPSSVDGFPVSIEIGGVFRGGA